MTDINSSHGTAPTAGRRRTPNSGGDEHISLGSQHVALVELLFFAYRDFTAGPDAILAEIGFGRAHHRVLHFVNRHPGLRVADLLGILKITKQSLARVLKQLVDEGYIEQTTGTEDRRERRLQVTDQGRNLAARLLTMQAELLAAALERAGPEASKVAKDFLFGVISPDERSAVAELVETGAKVSAAAGSD